MNRYLSPHGCLFDMNEPKRRVTTIVGAMVAGYFGVMASVASDPLVIEGPARVVDNSTLEIWGYRIRLEDIVAFEPMSVKGRKGQRYLEELVSGVAVRCVSTGAAFGASRSGRCFAGSTDIGAVLVELGYARRQTARKPSR